MKTKILLFAVALSVMSCTKKDGAQPAATAVSDHAIGKTYGGGIVFYLDGSGNHGLIAAESDAPGHSSWGGTTETLTTGKAVGTGQANTTAIKNEQGNGNPAYYCDVIVINNYTDWYLPSKDEMQLLFLQKTQTNTLGLAGSYWTSSVEGGSVWAQECTGGGMIQTSVTAFQKVRPVRSF